MGESCPGAGTKGFDEEKNKSNFRQHDFLKGVALPQKGGGEKYV